MPNWCSNTLVFQGSEEDVGFMLDVVGSETEDDGKIIVRSLSLNSIIKMPEALEGKSAPEKDSAVAEENIKLFGAKDWYDWRVKHWGTKWDVDSKIVFDQVDVMMPGLRTVKIIFDSAWGPPVEAISVLAKKFANINILHTFDEPGQDFSGWMYYIQGKLVEEISLGRSYYGITEVMDPSDITNVFERFT